MAESERSLRAIFEQAPLRIAIRDSKTGRFLRTNPRYCSIVGYSASEMLERTFREITHPEDLRADLDGMQAMLGGRVRSFQMENLTDAEVSQLQKSRAQTVRGETVPAELVLRDLRRADDGEQPACCAIPSSPPTLAVPHLAR